MNEAAIRYNCSKINGVLVAAAPSSLFWKSPLTSFNL